MKALTANQREVLFSLASLRTYKPENTRKRDGLMGWGTPMEFGGMNGSHHSHTAKALAKKGLLSRFKYGGHKGACWYRITDEGLAAAVELGYKQLQVRVKL